MCWQNIFLYIAESYIYLEFITLSSLIFLCDLPKYFLGPEVFCCRKFSMNSYLVGYHCKIWKGPPPARWSVVLLWKLLFRCLPSKMELWAICAKFLNVCKASDLSSPELSTTAFCFFYKFSLSPKKYRQFPFIQKV